ncbi:hypothetical protein ES703_102309 [subsurface metagenome]
MKKPFKKLKIILLTIIILVVIAIVAINLYADRAVKWGIETAGTKTLGVDVKLDNANLGILSGTLGLKKLIIDNPKEYKSQHLLELSNGNIQVRIGSLLSDVVEIKQIKLDGVDIVLEQKDVRSNNLQDILKNISKNLPKTEQPEESQQKLHIETLEISNINVELLPIPGIVDSIPLSLETIKMTDLGGDNKLSTPQLVMVILVAISKGIAQQGAGVLPDDIIGPLNISLSQLDQLSQTLLKEGQEILKTGGDIGKEAKEIGEDLGKEVKDITEGIKGLLKPKKDEN